MTTNKNVKKVQVNRPKAQVKRQAKPIKGKGQVKNDNKMDIVQETKIIKIAKSIGASKAKRGATIDQVSLFSLSTLFNYYHDDFMQKRGLNTTGKATNAQINKSIKKETVSIAKVAQTKKTPVVQNATLKISFNTADLAKTTNKVIADQVDESNMIE